MQWCSKNAVTSLTLLRAMIVGACIRLRLQLLFGCCSLVGKIEQSRGSTKKQVKCRQKRNIWRMAQTKSRVEVWSR